MQARGVGKGGLNRPPIESPMAICHSVRGDQYSVVQLRQEQRHRNLKQISELSIVDRSNPMQSDVDQACVGRRDR